MTLSKFSRMSLIITSSFSVIFLAQAQDQGSQHNAEQTRQGYQHQRDLYESSRQSADAPGAGEWKKTWGAMAVDFNTGKTGMVKGLDDKYSAEHEAINICTSKGSKSCRVLISYYNQCAALANGSRSSSNATAPTLELAEKTAIQVCEKSSDDCSVVYSDCTKPIFVRY